MRVVINDVSLREELLLPHFAKGSSLPLWNCGNWTLGLPVELGKYFVGLGLLGGILGLLLPLLMVYCALKLVLSFLPRTTVEVANNDFRFWKLLVEFYAGRGYRVVEAGLPTAQSLLEMNEDDAEVHALLGRMQFLAGNVAEGEISLRRALEMEPDLISARYHLARLLEAQGQTALAEEEYQRVIDWDTSGQYRKLALEGMQRLEEQ